VDATIFDALLVRVARQTTRRAALATLVGGILAMPDTAANAATKRDRRKKRRRQDHRRKDRRREDRRRKATTSLLRPIAIVVDNTGGPSPVTVEHGEWPYRQCCRSVAPVTIPVGTGQRFAASYPEAYVWIDDRFWLHFQNPALAPPNVSVAFAGMASSAICCKRSGDTVVNRHDLLVGRPMPVTLAGRTFTVTRTRDTNYKNFTIVLR
jgi:hypothetical protein